jgi:hypothetical protein
MKRAAKTVLIVMALVPLLAAGAGTVLAGGMLRPAKRPLDPELVRHAEMAFTRMKVKHEEFDVQAGDRAMLRGWKARATQPNGDWVLLFHGVSDNRMGMLGQAEMLLRNGYSVLLMDSRAHGASGGELATYGWIERRDVQSIADSLYANENVHCFFLLGSSMGASIALQAAAVEPRVAGVVAESAFANLKEVSFDYAGLRVSHWLGRTLFRPASSLALGGAEKEGGFRAEDVSPEKAVAERPFPVLLICGQKDRNIPPRHTKRIFEAASGPKEMWLVPRAGHAASLGTAPQEFENRLVKFFSGIHTATQNAERRSQN